MKPRPLKLIVGARLSQIVGMTTKDADALMQQGACGDSCDLHREPRLK